MRRECTQPVSLSRHQYQAPSARGQQPSSFIDAYHHQLRAGKLTADPQQLRVAESIQAFAEQLREKPGSRNALKNRIIPLKKALPSKSQGIYLWGGVGRGKTHLLNLFFETLPSERKLRCHFHHFMQLVHDELQSFGNEGSPLLTLARNLARDYQVICLDEMQVTDIADAMLLSGLFEALLKRGVSLFITSNTPPQRLYEGGLQRERFLPTIKLITDRLEVIHLDGNTDYRINNSANSATYWLPSADDFQEKNALGSIYQRLSGVPLHDDCSNLFINGRSLEAIQWAGGVAWFGFDALCAPPRSTADYLEIARIFNTVMISGIPQMDDSQLDRVTRFIHLIDCLYATRIRLVVSAATEPGALYTGDRATEKFSRTASRLEEMRSSSYFLTHTQYIEN